MFISSSKHEEEDGEIGELRLTAMHPSASQQSANTAAINHINRKHLMSSLLSVVSAGLDGVP